MKTGSPEYDRPHCIYSFSMGRRFMADGGGVWTFPTKGHAMRKARQLSRDWYLSQYGEAMPSEVNIDWHNGFAAAFYRVEPLEGSTDERSGFNDER